MKDVFRMTLPETALLRITGSRAYIHQLVLESVLNESAKSYDMVDAVRELFDKLSDENKSDVIYKITELVRTGANGKDKQGNAKNMFSAIDYEKFCKEIDEVNSYNRKFDAAYRFLMPKGKAQLIKSIVEKLDSSSSGNEQTFYYKGTRKDNGKDVKGEINASSQEEASAKLEKNGISVIKIASGGDSTSSDKNTSKNEEKKYFFFDATDKNGNHVVNQYVTGTSKEDLEKKLKELGYTDITWKSSKTAEEVISNIRSKIKEEQSNVDKKLERYVKLAFKNTLENFEKLDKEKKTQLIDKIKKAINGIDYDKLSSLDDSDKLIYLAAHADDIDSMKKVVDDFLAANLEKDKSDKNSSDSSSREQIEKNLIIQLIKDKLNDDGEKRLINDLKLDAQRKSGYEKADFESKQDNEERLRYLSQFLPADNLMKAFEQELQRQTQSEITSTDSDIPRPSSGEEEPEHSERKEPKDPEENPEKSKEEQPENPEKEEPEGSGEEPEKPREEQSENPEREEPEKSGKEEPEHSERKEPKDLGKEKEKSGKEPEEKINAYDDANDDDTIISRITSQLNSASSDEINGILNKFLSESAILESEEYDDDNDYGDIKYKLMNKAKKKIYKQLIKYPKENAQSLYDLLIADGKNNAIEKDEKFKEFKDEYEKNVGLYSNSKKIKFNEDTYEKIKDDQHKIAYLLLCMTTAEILFVMKTERDKFKLHIWDKWRSDWREDREKTRQEKAAEQRKKEERQRERQQKKKEEDQTFKNNVQFSRYLREHDYNALGSMIYGLKKADAVTKTEEEFTSIKLGIMLDDKDFYPCVGITPNDKFNTVLFEIDLNKKNNISIARTVDDWLDAFKDKGRLKSMKHLEITATGYVDRGWARKGLDIKDPEISKIGLIIDNRIRRLSLRPVNGQMSLLLVIYTNGDSRKKSAIYA